MGNADVHFCFEVFVQVLLVMYLPRTKGSGDAIHICLHWALAKLEAAKAILSQQCPSYHLVQPGRITLKRVENFTAPAWTHPNPQRDPRNRSNWMLATWDTSWKTRWRHGTTVSMCNGGQADSLIHDVNKPCFFQIRLHSLARFWWREQAPRKTCCLLLQNRPPKHMCAALKQSLSNCSCQHSDNGYQYRYTPANECSCLDKNKFQIKVKPESKSNRLLSEIYL